MTKEYVGLIERAIDYEEVKRLMIDLVATPSPQTDLLEAEPQVIEFIKKAVEPRLRDFGIDNIRYDDMGNLVARYGDNRSGRRLLFVTHAMNHPPASMPSPYEAKVIDGKKHGLPGEAVLGRGLCEQKAGMAAMLTAIKAIVAAKIPIEGELLFLTCTSGETGKHDALRNLIQTENISADMGLIDGCSLKIRLGNRGRQDVFITVRGAVSHSGSPHKGANAITGAQRVLKKVLSEVKLPEPHPDLGPCTLTCTHIRSFPDATHTVQGECELTFDRRLLPSEDPDEAFQEIKAIAKSVEQEPDPASGESFEVEVVQGPFMYPSLVSEDSDIVRLIRKSSKAILGNEPDTHYGKSAFDQGYLNHLGIETANYGPGEDDFAHTDFDMVSVDRTRDGAKVMAMMVCNYLARSAMSAE